MAFADLQAYLTAYERALPLPVKNFSSRTAVSGTFTVPAVGGAAPTTPTQCFDTTVGAHVTPIPDTNSPLYLAAWITMSGGTTPQNGCVGISDRLSHAGGLSTTITTEQTTNLPTAALPRYTNGVGVMIGLDVYTATGAAATTVRVQYTNSDGVANRVSKDVVWPAKASIGRRFIVPLQDGDVGVLSVEGVTFAGSTGTAGDVGVTLFKMLAMPPMMNDVSGTDREALNVLYGSCAEVLHGACLELVSFTGASAQTVAGVLRLVES